ncbi:indolepyruvate ferredoxin oxidoreductase, beta subunit [Methanosalsum zhilinae DSM 4017]|uniref:Indolepyruvate ferredoxin oxidoreductase subunit beta n=1 Tax=Methanosalsum zhilinae (strain DSM 4017 / NBRC 107636 / OCM 62 / WeN5) TaxID=679901 RepID=F7XMR1_METZD|nr:indolepyruvate oxidoreductase subunit beta [Methanosalsum zhilinae]AEH61084.1 indolepyruvate ferredoxin oxidoreductase, beta subunit [Methanosalsum zhilinae DSM 4017]
MSEKKTSKFDLIISGVGGQGTILASDIIGKAAVLSGYSVRAAETHGMAQRGGSVINHIRIGCDLGSLIPPGGADIMLALEPSEAIRYIEYLSPGGTVIMNTEPVYPVSVLSGKSKYPDISAILKELEDNFTVNSFDATGLARKAGHQQSMNVVMVGALSNYLPFESEVLVGCIKEMVPPRTLDINMEAFRLGKSQITDQ